MNRILNNSAAPGLNKSTVPRASIDLLPNSKKLQNMVKQESNDDTVNNIQSDNSETLQKYAAASHQDSGEDANMDSDSNFTFQSNTYQNEPSIKDIKQAAVRKFIDSENEENLYVMQDGTLVIECIKTSKIKRVKQTSELMLPLKSFVSGPQGQQTGFNYGEPKKQDRNVNINLDELQNHIAMLNYQNQSNAANLAQVMAFLEQSQK